MIAPLKNEQEVQATVQEKFLKMLPQIRQHAYFAFCGLPRESRDDLVAEVVANCFCAFTRLVSLGKEDIAYPKPLAHYAIRQVREGRRVGTPFKRNDVMSASAQRFRHVRVERLDRFSPYVGEWQEILVEDRKAGPAEIAAVRIDFGTWLDSLSNRNRRIAETLATGETTNVVAKRFGLTAGRVSQLRTLLKASWERLQGEAQPQIIQIADAS